MTLRLTEAEFLVLAGRSPLAKKQLVIAGGYTSKVSGWLTFGKRKYYFKSLWEMNYARYLQFLKSRKEIYDWKYEPETFDFPKDDYGAGPFSYKPDFQVFSDLTHYEWHEVKGWLNPSSKKKLKRFYKHFPKEGEIKLIGKDWFSKVSRSYPSLIPGWETLKQALKRVETEESKKKKAA